jgi:hypothetical protein
MGPFDKKCERCRRGWTPPPKVEVPEVVQPIEPPPDLAAARRAADDARIEALKAEANAAGSLSSMSCVIGLLFVVALVLVLLCGR